MQITGIIKGATMLMSKHKSALMVAASIVSTTASVLLTAKAVKETTEWTLEEKALVDDPETVTKTEVIKKNWTRFIGAGLSFVSSITFAVMAHKVDAKKIAAASAALALSEQNYKDLEDKVKRELGFQKSKELKKEIAQDRVNANPPSPLPMGMDLTKRGPYWILEPISGRYFRAVQEDVRGVVNSINRIALLESGLVTLNDWYYGLNGITVDDMDDTRLGECLGWDIRDSDLLDVTFEPAIAPNGEPCFVLEYNRDPRMI